MQGELEAEVEGEEEEKRHRGGRSRRVHPRTIISNDIGAALVDKPWPDYEGSWAESPPYSELFHP